MKVFFLPLFVVSLSWHLNRGLWLAVSLCKRSIFSLMPSSCSLHLRCWHTGAKIGEDGKAKLNFTADAHSWKESSRLTAWQSRVLSCVLRPALGHTAVKSPHKHPSYIYRVYYQHLWVRHSWRHLADPLAWETCLDMISDVPQKTKRTLTFLEGSFSQNVHEDRNQDWTNIS